MGHEACSRPGVTSAKASCAGYIIFGGCLLQIWVPMPHPYDPSLMPHASCPTSTPPTPTSLHCPTPLQARVVGITELLKHEKTKRKEETAVLKTKVKKAEIEQFQAAPEKLWAKWQFAIQMRLLVMWKFNVDMHGANSKATMRLKASIRATKEEMLKAAGDGNELTYVIQCRFLEAKCEELLQLRHRCRVLQVPPGAPLHAPQPCMPPSLFQPLIGLRLGWAAQREHCEIIVSPTTMAGGISVCTRAEMQQPYPGCKCPSQPPRVQPPLQPSPLQPLLGLMQTHLAAT